MSWKRNPKGGKKKKKERSCETSHQFPIVKVDHLLDLSNDLWLRLISHLGFLENITLGIEGKISTRGNLRTCPVWQEFLLSMLPSSSEKYQHVKHYFLQKAL